MKSEVFINVRAVSKHFYDNTVLYFPFSIEKISLLYHKEHAKYNLKMTLISVNELLFLIQIQLFWLQKKKKPNNNSSGIKAHRNNFHGFPQNIISYLVRFLKAIN